MKAQPCTLYLCFRNTFPVWSVGYCILKLLRAYLLITTGCLQYSKYTFYMFAGTAVLILVL